MGNDSVQRAIDTETFANKAARKKGKFGKRVEIEQVCIEEAQERGIHQTQYSEKRRAGLSSTAEACMESAVNIFTGHTDQLQDGCVGG